MKLLLILLSAVMTWTVKTKSSVELAEGSIVPYDIGVSYANTGNKGSVTDKDTATLSLSGLENLRLESIQIYMRSNKSAGAGVITMTADGEQIYRKSGMYVEWFGSYDNTNYHPTGWTGSKQLVAGTLVIEVVGTENSLHIEKYAITYSQPAATAYNVTLMTEGVAQVLTESAPESGVVLPDRPDQNGLYFAGWALEEVDKTSNQPYMLSPGTLYQPKKDITFWAVWSNVQEPTWEKHPTPESGYYIMDLFGLTLTGTVNNGVVPMVDNSEMVYANELYYIDFNTADATCTIRNCAANEYIGFNSKGTSLMAAESAWQYRILSDSTWFFIAKEVGEKAWMLYQKNYYSYEASLSDFTRASEATGGGWELYKLPDPDIQRHWTSHPSVEAVEITSEWMNGLKGEWIIPFGIYDLIIKDGKKYLRVKE